LAKAQQSLRDQAGMLDADIKRLDAELAKAEAAIPADFRDGYQRLVNSKHDDAMAEVQGECCGGCFQRLTPNNLSELSMSLGIFCRNCGRLIYLPEDRTPGKKG
jgi:predicted  nucleic acid-binding Zn-ribbon protein